MFWNKNINPVTMYAVSAPRASYSQSSRSTKWILTNEGLEDYITVNDCAKQLRLGVVKCRKLFESKGFNVKSGAKGRYFYKSDLEIVLKDYKIPEIRDFSNSSDLITFGELLEAFGIEKWKGNVIKKMSKAEPVKRVRGSYFYFKKDILPFFEEYSKGNLILNRD